MLAPSLFELSVLDGVLDAKPARAFDFSLQNEQLQHALVGAENALKGVALQSGGKWRLSCRVLDLEEFVFTMWNRHFKTVLARDKLALELGNLFELIGPHRVELHDHAFFERLFFLFTHCLPLCAIFDLRIHKDGSLHTLDFERAGYERLGLWLPDLAKEVKISTIVLFMRIEPIEGKCAVFVELQRQLLMLIDIRARLLLLLVQLILLNLAPFLFHFGFFGLEIKLVLVGSFVEHVLLHLGGVIGDHGLRLHFWSCVLGLASVSLGCSLRQGLPGLTVRGLPDVLCI